MHFAGLRSAYLTYDLGQGARDSIRKVDKREAAPRSASTKTVEKESSLLFACFVANTRCQP